MRRGRKLVLATLAAFALVPAASAMAADAFAKLNPATPTQMQFLAPNNVVQDDVMTVQQDATNMWFIAIDSTAGVTVQPTAPCVNGPAHGGPLGSAACPKAGDGVHGALTSIQVNSNEGNDTITIDDSAPDAVAGVTTELNGSVGDDAINGGAINDVIDGGGNADDMDGRGGTDQANYSDRGAAVTVKNGDGIAFDGSATDVSINPGNPFLRDFVQASVEDVVGGNGDDNLTGNDFNNFLDGDDGNDFLMGGRGSDNLAGGSGRDTASYTDHTSQVYVLIDTVFQDGNGVEDSSNPPGNSNLDKVRTDVEKVSGTPFNDTLIGTLNEDVANELHGGVGNDYLVGLNGNDDLFGEQGNDTILGGSGEDEPDGSTGDDTLNGDSGNDIITGGTGRDRMSGGKGSKDYIKAKDHIRDISIKCGKGRHDKARVDKRHPKDPKAKGCEKKTG